jgi:hypothetical protein
MRLDGADGALKMRAPLIGDAGDPLRFGYASLQVTSATFTVPPTEAGKLVLELFGLLTAPTTIILPKVAGFAKLVINATAGAFPLRVGFTAGSGAVVPRGGHWIYSDGIDIRRGWSNTLVDLKSAQFANALGNREFQTASPSLVDVPGLSVSFDDAQMGDSIEVNATVLLESPTAGECQVIVTQPDGPILKREAVGRAINGMPTFLPLAMRHIVSSSGPLSVKLQARLLGPQGFVAVNSPSSLVGRQVRV